MYYHIRINVRVLYNFIMYVYTYVRKYHMQETFVDYIVSLLSMKIYPQKPAIIFNMLFIVQLIDQHVMALLKSLLSLSIPSSILPTSANCQKGRSHLIHWHGGGLHKKLWSHFMPIRNHEFACMLESKNYPTNFHIKF